MPDRNTFDPRICHFDPRIPNRNLWFGASGANGFVLSSCEPLSESKPDFSVWNALRAQNRCAKAETVFSVWNAVRLFRSAFQTEKSLFKCWVRHPRGYATAPARVEFQTENFGLECPQLKWFLCHFEIIFHFRKCYKFWNFYEMKVNFSLSICGFVVWSSVGKVRQSIRLDLIWKVKFIWFRKSYVLAACI